jgi:hypothetical protein
VAEPWLPARRGARGLWARAALAAASLAVRASVWRVAAAARARASVGVAWRAPAGCIHTHTHSQYKGSTHMHRQLAPEDVGQPLTLMSPQSRVRQRSMRQSVRSSRPLQLPPPPPPHHHHHREHRTTGSSTTPLTLTQPRYDLTCA